MSTKNKRIYHSPPNMGGSEQKYITEAFETNRIVPLGEDVNEFEKYLQFYCSIKYAAALSSGTATVHLDLIIFGIKPGDDVFP